MLTPLRLTREQVRRVDQICIDEYGIPGLLLMENAARALLDAALAMRPSSVLIVCGGGNNGGDGYALARHLHNRGIGVTLAAARRVEQLEGDARVNAEICRKMRLPLQPAASSFIEADRSDLVVDALLGTGLSKAPRDDAAEMIRAINSHGGHVLAVDVPSGLDCDTGRPLGPPSACVRADRTVTFVAEKIGFDRAAAWVGEVSVGDVGCPREVIQRVLAM